MIHFTVAAPMGIDSVFFSFIERFALQNGHVCIDPPAAKLDVTDPGGWIQGLRGSDKHNFVIGHRYPPPYWKELADCATTVCLLADPEGIARQVETIHQSMAKESSTQDPSFSLKGLTHVLEDTMQLTEFILSNKDSTSFMLTPSTAYAKDPLAAFQRLEAFYVMAGVPLKRSCYTAFSEESVQHLTNNRPPSHTALQALYNELASSSKTASRLAALDCFFAANNFPTNYSQLESSLRH